MPKKLPQHAHFSEENYFNKARNIELKLEKCSHFSDFNPILFIIIYAINYYLWHSWGE